MSPLLSFESCRERVQRAQAHNKAFADAWNAFLADEPYTPFIRIDESGWGELRVEANYEPLPSLFAWELGEMLYHLRAALDSCVYAAAIEESGQDPPPDHEKLEFPLCFSPEAFKKAAWHIAPLTGKRREIVESMQPYKVPSLPPNLMILNGNRTLGILHDWARKDRHRKLHVVGSWASNANPQLRLPDGCALDYMLTTRDGLLEHDGLIASFQLTGYVPGMKIEGNPDLAIDVAVDEDPKPCADNDQLSERLRQMIVWTKMITEVMEESFIEERRADSPL